MQFGAAGGPPGLPQVYELLAQRHLCGARVSEQAHHGVQGERRIEGEERVHARLLGEAHVKGRDGQKQRGQQADRRTCAVRRVGQAASQEIEHGDGQRATQGGEGAHGGSTISQEHPPVQQGVVERRVLVNVDQPGPHAAQGLPAEPDTERFVEPQRLAADLVEAQGATQGDDRQQEERGGAFK